MKRCDIVQSDCPFLSGNRHRKIVSCPQSSCGIADHFATRCLFNTGDLRLVGSLRGSKRHRPVARSDSTHALFDSLGAWRVDRLDS
jgi:hypothetical protein